MQYVAVGLFALGIVCLVLRALSERYQETPAPPRITVRRMGSAVEAHYHVHERGGRHVCVHVKEPENYEQELSLKELLRDHADDPRVDLSGVRMPVGHGGGRGSSGGVVEK